MSESVSLFIYHISLTFRRIEMHAPKKISSVKHVITTHSVDFFPYLPFVNHVNANHSISHIYICLNSKKKNDYNVRTRCLVQQSIIFCFHFVFISLCFLSSEKENCVFKNNYHCIFRVNANKIVFEWKGNEKRKINKNKEIKWFYRNLFHWIIIMIKIQFFRMILCANMSLYVIKCVCVCVADNP